MATMRQWRRAAALAVTLSLFACGKRTGGDAHEGEAKADAGIAGREAAFLALARAEDTRDVEAVSEALLRHDDPSVRRRAVRAIARIGQEAGVRPLLSSLGSEDEAEVAWAAYGLGRICRGHEEAFVPRLALRLSALAASDSGAASLEGTLAPGAAGRRGEAEVDARVALVRAIGRCGGGAAQATLVGILTGAAPDAPDVAAESAAFALGDIASRGGLSDATRGKLVDVLVRASGTKLAMHALYPVGRLETVDGPLAEAARNAADAAVLPARASAGVSPLRLFAIRALARTGREAAASLEAVLAGEGYAVSERAEAARGLGRLGAEGRAAAERVLSSIALGTGDAARSGARQGARDQARDDALRTLVLGEEIGVVLPLVAVLAHPDTPLPARAARALRAFASLDVGPDPDEGRVRRIVRVRCEAASSLAGRDVTFAPLLACDAPARARGIATDVADRSRLRTLGRMRMDRERIALWATFAASGQNRVREDALELLKEHPELGETGRRALEAALASDALGVVATAAEVLHTRPDRALVPTARERKAALDPREPLHVDPEREGEPRIVRALEAALARALPEDAVEVRTSLLDAAVALRAPSAKRVALAACRDANVTIRERAEKALRALGETKAACPRPPLDAENHRGSSDAAADAPVDKPTRVVFRTDRAHAGELAIAFEPELAPMAASRFVALARAGFYRGVEVHRVVPGFVAQFGDPAGDGFGGSGKLLRCETSPVPFAPFDVGVALAGRDTGSSQLFVMLARHPHLDGEYARVGRAEGDWAAVAEGERIVDVRVSD
jgi:cyclophilin family peptidyl-prolyl cis-trans isomerase/HEAT repeat protein